MNEIEILNKALELACQDAADDQCPYEFGFCKWDECSNCPHDSEFYLDSKRDVNCWKRYYLEKAESIGK